MTAKCARCGQERAHLLHEPVMPGTLSHGVGDLRDMPAHAFASPPPPAVPDVEACDGPFCAVCGAREPHPLDVCLNVLRQRLTAEQAELRAAREAIASRDQLLDTCGVAALARRKEIATLLAIAEAAEALSNGLSAYDGAQPEDAVHIYDRNEEALATLRARLAERGK